MWVESVNSTIFFWHAQKLMQGVYLRDFIIVIYGKFNTFPAPFSAFFHLVCKLLKSLFCLFLLVSKFHELISEMSRSLIMNLYLRAFSIAIYQKFSLYLFVPIETFFWSANCTILVCKLCLLFQTILDLWPVLILEIFSCWDIKKGQFEFLVSFLVVFSGL